MICKICGDEHHNLSNHVLKKHGISQKDYFDKYLKTEENTHCKLCGAELTEFVKISYGYGKYCKNCSHKDKMKLQWSVKSKTVKNEIYEKRIATCKDIYGDEYKEIFSAKQTETCKNRTPEKQALVSKHHHDERMRRDNEKMSNACKETKLRNHGDAKYNNTQKARETYYEKTGYANPSLNPDVVAHLFDDYEKRTGYANPSHNPDVISKMRKKYSYQGQTFDSSWEIAYYIWLKDHNISFSYHVKPITYMFENRKHKYFPDFDVNGRLVEIKNPELLKRMKDNIGTLENAKYNCMIEHGVEIKDNVDEYLTYINDKYGKDYLQQFRNDEYGSK